MKDLDRVLMFDNQPVRMGVVGDEVVFCLADLLSAVGKRTVNVTYALRKIPKNLYMKVSCYELNGLPVNSKAIAVTKEGAIMTLCRSSKIDLNKVYRLMKWLETIDGKLIKK